MEFSIKKVSAGCSCSLCSFVARANGTVPLARAVHDYEDSAVMDYGPHRGDFSPCLTRRYTKIRTISQNYIFNVMNRTMLLTIQLSLIVILS